MPGWRTRAAEARGVLVAILTVGLPGAGKSTYAKRFQGWANLSRDELRKSLLGDQGDRSREGLVHMRLIQAIARAAAMERDVVISDTNATPKVRRSLIKLLRKLGFARIEAHVLDVSADTCRLRNAARPQPVPAEAMARMETQLRRSPPTLAEGFDAIVNVCQEGIAPFYS